MSVGVTALIAAAGGGLRLGRGPKALLRLGDKTLLQHTLTAFAGAVDEVIVALPADLPGDLPADLPADLAPGLSGSRSGVRFVAGGRTRQESVWAMLQASHGELVVVHDVARPFVPREVLSRVVAAAREHGAATAALPLADTIVETVVDESERYGPVLDRDRLRAIQTPQAFQRALLLEAHSAAAEAGLDATDDAALVRALDRPVALVAGSRRLFKITEREDLDLAVALLARSPGDVGSQRGDPEPGSVTTEPPRDAVEPGT